MRCYEDQNVNRCKLSNRRVSGPIKTFLFLQEACAKTCEVRERLVLVKWHIYLRKFLLFLKDEE